MSSSVAVFRPRRTGRLAATPEARERSKRRRVGLVWGLLILNALTYYGTVVPIPSAIGKASRRAPCRWR